MASKFVFAAEAEATLAELNRADPAKKLKKVLKALGQMQTNLRYPSLCTHEYDEYTGLNGEPVFESYAENNTPGAYRIFWHYGPGRGVITIIAITPHP